MYACMYQNTYIAPFRQLTRSSVYTTAIGCQSVNRSFSHLVSHPGSQPASWLIYQSASQSIPQAVSPRASLYMLYLTNRIICS